MAPKKPMPSNLQMPKRPSPWLVLIIVVLVFTFASSVLLPSEEAQKIEEIPITSLLTNFKDGKYEKVQIKGEEIIGTLADTKAQEKAVRLPNETLEDLGLKEPPAGTSVEVISLEKQQFWVSMIGEILPFVIIVGVILFLMSRMTKNAGGPFSFGKSKEKVFDRRRRKTKFEDVAGAVEAKEELHEIVDFLKNPRKYTKMGAKIPRGVLLVGPPGTGKTLLARAVAGEADVPFMSISGSEFVEMFVGVGASRVRDLFEKAKRNAPSIVFIDEIDAVGRQRGGAGFGGGHDEREQTLNQILTEMDGFEKDTNVIVMAATNRPDVLDKALLRPGRFDRRVVIDKPDIKAREDILKVHGRDKPLEENINLNDIARITVGFAGADLENLMNEAAILAARENRKTITQSDLSKSVEKVSLGPERKSMVMKKEHKQKTAYHEAGHAIMAYVMPHADMVHKLTIVSRGMSLGATWMLPEEDEYSKSKSKFLDEICVALGGYAAETIVYGETATGTSEDLRKASLLARSMATRYGMSDLGPVSYADAEDHSGYEYLGLKGISEEFSRKVDEFVQRTVNECLQKSLETLTKYRQTMDDIVAELMQKETLDQKEFEAFFEKKIGEHQEKQVPIGSEENSAESIEAKAKKAK